MNKAIAIRPFGDLVQEGRIVAPQFLTTFGTAKTGGIDFIIDNYGRWCAGKKAIVFCTTVDQAESIAWHLRVAGISATSVLGDQNRAERDCNIERFRHGDLMVLVTVKILLDSRWPETDAVIIANPTHSRTLFFQQVSVGLTPRFAAEMPQLTSAHRRDAIAASSKPHAIILDVAGNIARHGLEDF